ncbi:MAG: DUF3526 domain-containing protein [Polyangiales bacterium]
MLRIVRLSARHEITRALRLRTFRVGLLVMSALLVAAFVLEAERLALDAREREALTQHERDQWEKQPDRHPHRMAHYGLYAFRPPSPLGFFDAGVEPFTGSAVFLEPHRRNPPNFSAASQASELVRFGRPTAAFVLQLLLPLLIFCATFDSVAGEREAGTYRLALAQGVSARALLLGKVLGHVALAFAWVAPALVVTVGIQLVRGALAPSADTFLRLGALTLTYGAYLALCAALGVAVSALHRRGHGALLTLLAVWIVGWVVVPRAAGELAARLRPVPSRAALELDIARASRAQSDHGSDGPAAMALQRQLFAKHGVSRVEDLPMNVKGLLMQQGEDATTALYDTHYGALRAAQERQDALVNAFGVISPPLALRGVSMALAGSGPDAFSAFLAQAEHYRTYFIAELNRLQAQLVRYDEDRTSRVGHAHFAEIRPFAYARAPLDVASLGALPAVLAPVVWLLVLGGLVFRGSGREEERA